MQDSEIYSKTDAGRDEIRTRARHLPGAIRSILLMVDGQRTVGQFRDIIAGSKAPPETLETLLSQGLIEARIEQGTPVAASHPPETPVSVAAVAAPPPAAEAPPPLSLPEASSPAAVEMHDATPAVPPAAAAPKAGSRYDRLYAIMSEVVRDFLAPHRRYFIQLKIERCSTADELLELLHELHFLLAKARGEPFAAEVVSRVRDAAN